MLIIVCVLTSLFVFMWILSPFFIGEGGKLLAHSALATEESLELMRKNLLTNYIKCEGLYKNHQLKKREWEQRQIFLTNRFIDASRRLDALRRKKI